MAYYDDISALNPDFWWRLDGDETDSAGSLDSDGGTDPSWVDSIIPAIESTNECGDYNGIDYYISWGNQEWAHPT